MDEVWKYRGSAGPQVIPILVTVDYTLINKQWLKEVQILQMPGLLDSQRIWEESFGEEEMVCSACMNINYWGWEVVYG